MNIRRFNAAEGLYTVEYEEEIQGEAEVRDIFSYSQSLEKLVDLMSQLENASQLTTSSNP